MDSQGRPRHVLGQIAERYPVVLHGVSLSIGSTDPLNFDYLAKLKRLAQQIRPRWISDHLCWTGVLGLNAHDLLPIPLNEETLAHVVARVRTVQDYLERPLVLENPSTYVTFADSTMSEWAFLTRLAAEADCGLLIDVNNVYVSSVNHDFDPREYIENLPHERIVQCHLAGHTNCGTHLIDTHDDHVIDPVWELYRLAHQLTGGISTLLEWDARIPEFHGGARRSAQGPRGDCRPAVSRPGASRCAAARRRGLKPHRVPRGRPSMSQHTGGGEPSDLQRLQRWMQSVITHPGGVSEGVASVRSREHLELGPAGLESVIARSRALTSAQRLEIYVDAYHERLLECLREEFPATRHAVGDELFDALAFGYLQHEPSRSYTLGELGAATASFPQHVAAARASPRRGGAGELGGFRDRTGRLRARRTRDLRWPGQRAVGGPGSHRIGGRGRG